MDRQELIKSMKQHVNGASFINTTQLAEFLGQKSRDRVKSRYLNGLERVGKYYFIPDVATSIQNRSRAGGEE